MITFLRSFRRVFFTVNLTLLLAVLLVSGSGRVLASGSAAAYGAEPGGQPAVTRTADGLVVDWRVPEPAFQVESGGRTKITIAGYDREAIPGAVEVPFQSLLVALPEGAQPVVQVQQALSRWMRLEAPLTLSPVAKGVLYARDGNPIGQKWEAPDMETPAAFNLVEIQPLGKMRGVNLARLVLHPAIPEEGGLRIYSRVRVAVKFNAPEQPPAALAYEKDVLVDQVRQMVINPDQVRAVFPTASGDPGRLALTSEQPVAIFDIGSKGIYAVSYAALQGIGFDAATTAVKLTHNGAPVAYLIDGGDGDAFLESGERLLFYGDYTPNRWSYFDTYVLWAGAGAQVGTRNATPGSEADGKKMVEVTFEQDRLYVPDRLQTVTLPLQHDGDRWAWERLAYPGDSNVPSWTQKSFTLNNVDTAQSATLTIWMIGGTSWATINNDHTVRVTLNGQVVGTAVWDGYTAYSYTATVSGSWLVNGNNTLRLDDLTNAYALDEVWLDAFKVRYTLGAGVEAASLGFNGEAAAKKYSLTLDAVSGLQAWDVTTPTTPVALTVAVNASTVSLADPVGNTTARRYFLASGSRIMTPQAIRLAKNLENQNLAGADEIIITHANFRPALDSLIALRQSQGLSVAVEDVQAIFDTMGGGIPTPEAIRAYLLAAYQTWTPKPAYVLLVGDATVDPKHHYTTSPNVNYIPVPLISGVSIFQGELSQQAAGYQGEMATDHYYVALDGNDLPPSVTFPVDILPDLAIGRLPVNTLAETQAVVNKIVSYETNTAAQMWKGQALFIADDPGSTYGGQSSSDFPRYIVDLSDGAYLPQPPFSIIRQSLGNKTPNTVSSVRANLRNLWNSGLGLLMFYGHASYHQWSGDLILHIGSPWGSDPMDPSVVRINQLTNGSKLPVVLEMTCFTGQFWMPAEHALDEALLRYAGGGAVAVFSPSTFESPIGHEALARGFMKEYQFGVKKTVGMASVRAKAELYYTYYYPNMTPPFDITIYGYLRDMIWTYNLLGDPAMKLAVDWVNPVRLYLPNLSR
ncbi:MAG TPA: C25 family cysteine peptidase [Anaerolineaceae bacterium]